jgi:hypothetical protein
MKIDESRFGSITIDGTRYDHDVIIRLSEKIKKRKKELSKKVHGTSHIISEEEARFVHEKGCEELILGTGQNGLAGLSPEAKAFFKSMGVRVVARPTPEAVDAFNKSKAARVGLFHVTC